MNITITESDKKLLSFLAAFLLAAAFVFLIFRPLSAKCEQLETELVQARAQEADRNEKAALADGMTQKEEETTAHMQQVLARFYPVLQSQDAERMVTTLLLNHDLSVQSLTVVMPERSAELNWYQYAKDAASYAEPAEEEEQAAFSLYVAKVTCVAEGSKENLWSLIDDISAGYPAISISGTEWSSTERIVTENTAYVTGEDVQEHSDTAEPVTKTTDRLTISLEIYMCNQ